jgi:CubicO group peptidase (beta-lactamase class C family)
VTARALSAPAGPAETQAIQPGAVLRVHPPDSPPAQAQAGLASLELASPIGEHTVFNTGSVAKQITAHLLILAARDHALTLDQTVASLLPRFRLADVTVADLIQHHGGVRDAESMLSLAGFRDLDHYTSDDLLQLAYRQHHRAVPPGQFLYSNTGYLLLAEILCHIHGTSLQATAEQRVFTPLGMTSSFFQADPRDVVPAAASSYQPDPAGWTRTQRPVALPGPGTLWSTTADIDRWLGHLHRNRSTNDWLPFAADLPYRPSDHPPWTYGPGLYADPRPGQLTVFHNGHEQGFSAAAHLTRTGLRITCLSNHAGVAADHIAATALRQLIHQEADLNQLISAAITEVRPAPATMTRHADDMSTPEHTHIHIGTYSSDDVPGTLRLTRSDGQLHLWRRGRSQRLTLRSTRTYIGDGYVLTLPTTPDNDNPPGFVLDLDRAPGIQYRRVPTGPESGSMPCSSCPLSPPGARSTSSSSRSSGLRRSWAP